MIASTVPLKARYFAASGSSKDPGTEVSKILSSSTLHSLSAFFAPSTRLVTCSSFQRVRMIPTRTLDPSSSPNDTSLSAAYFQEIYNIFGMRMMWKNEKRAKICKIFILTLREVRRAALFPGANPNTEVAKREVNRIILLIILLYSSTSS